MARKPKTYWCKFHDGQPSEYHLFNEPEDTAVPILHGRKKYAGLLGSDIRKVRIVEVKK